jgi:hypothetical protein
MQDEYNGQTAAHRRHLYRAYGDRCGLWPERRRVRCPELSKPAPGHLLDKDYLTSSGETVARPGVPKSSGDTPFDRYMRQQNDRIDNSIRKGC